MRRKYNKQNDYAHKFKKLRKIRLFFKFTISTKNVFFSITISKKSLFKRKKKHKNNKYFVCRCEHPDARYDKQLS